MLSDNERKHINVQLTNKQMTSQVLNGEVNLSDSL